MRKIITSLVAALTMALAIFPLQGAWADEWDYPYTVPGLQSFTYDASSVPGYLQQSIQNAMNGWNNIYAYYWGPPGSGPFVLTTSGSNQGEIVYVTSNWTSTANSNCNSLSYVGCTFFPYPSSGTNIQTITTWLDVDPNSCGGSGFTLNTGTTSSGCSYSLQDLMVHELGFAVSLYEHCYPANSDFGTPADTVQNSVMCDVNLANNNSAPQSNDIAAVQYIYQGP